MQASAACEVGLWQQLLRALPCSLRRCEKNGRRHAKALLNQSLGSNAIIRTATTPAWQIERYGMVVSGVGAAELLHGPLLAFFASRQCPGAAIRAGTAWALQQGRSRSAVIGGFHSPLEQSVLRLLLGAGCPVVVVLARPAMGASLHSTWRDAFAAKKMAVVSASATRERLTARAAGDRNELAARLADRVVVAHASPGGQLSGQCDRWLSEGLLVERLAANGGAARLPA